MQRDLCDAFDAVDADPAARSVVVTGSGRAFARGADLGSGERTFAGGKRSGRDPGGVVTLRIFDCTKPVIAAVNGPAIGVGASMTLRDGRSLRLPTRPSASCSLASASCPRRARRGSCRASSASRPPSTGCCGSPVAHDALAFGLAQHVADDVVTAATSMPATLSR